MHVHNTINNGLRRASRPWPTVTLPRPRSVVLISAFAPLLIIFRISSLLIKPLMRSVHSFLQHNDADLVQASTSAQYTGDFNALINTQIPTFYTPQLAHQSQAPFQASHMIPGPPDLGFIKSTHGGNTFESARIGDSLFSVSPLAAPEASQWLYQPRDHVSPVLSLRPSGTQWNIGVNSDTSPQCC